MTPSGEWMATWRASDSTTGGINILGRRYDATGNPESEPFVVASGTPSPQINTGNYLAINSAGEFAAAWVTKNQNGKFDAYWRLFGADRLPRNTATLVHSQTLDDQNLSGIALDESGNATIVYSERAGANQQTFYRRYDRNGVPVGNTVAVGMTAATDHTGGPVVQLADGKTMIVWNSKSGDTLASLFRRYSNDQVPTTAGLPDVSVSEDASPVTVNLTSRFADPDDPAALTYTVSSSDVSLVTGSTFDAASGNLLLNLGANRFGSSVITITAVDSKGASIATSFTLTVAPVNDPPFINVIAAQTVMQNSTAKTIAISGITVGPNENQGLSLAVTTDKPEFFSKLSVTRTGSSANGVISYTLVPNAIGDAVITVTATDDGGTDAGGVNSFSRSFTLHITPDLTVPTVTLDMTPNTRTDPAPQLVLRFSEAIPSLSLSQITLSRDGSPNLLGSDQTLTTTDNITWTINNTSDITFLAGSYRLTFSDVLDGVGNKLAAGTVATFTVTQSTLNATENADQWSVTLVGSSIEIAMSGGQNRILSFPAASADTIVVFLKGGDDTFTIDGSIPVTFNLFGGGGNDSLIVSGTFGDDRLVVSNSAAGIETARNPYSQFEQVELHGAGGKDLLVSDGLSTFVSPTVPGVMPAVSTTVKRVMDGGTGEDTLLFSNGVYLIDADLAASAEQVNISNAVVSFSTFQHIPALNLSSGGKVIMTAGGSSLLTVEKLLSTTDSWIDLADNTMVLRSTAATRNDALAQLLTLASTARNNGSTDVWSGKGLTTSSASATRGLAVMLNDQGNGQAILPGINGEPIDANAIVARFTYNGDTDLNGMITFDDYFRLDLARATGAAPSYRNGDFNYDGRIDADDYALIDRAFISQAAPAGAAALAIEAPSVAATSSIDLEPRKNIRRASAPRHGEAKAKQLPQRPPHRQHTAQAAVKNGTVFNMRRRIDEVWQESKKDLWE